MRGLRKQISFKKWRTKEPLDDTLEIEQPLMLGKATSMLLDAGIISPSLMMNEINLNKKIISCISGIQESEFDENSASTELPLSII